MNDPTNCPLCGQPNNCQLCTTEAYKGPCWCASVVIPDELTARVSSDLRSKACICKICVAAFHRKVDCELARGVMPGDFYLDVGGLVVFTEAYHRRRGYCCGSGCRHCPYEAKENPNTPI